MDNKANVTNNSSKLVNWVTVWGFILSVIAYNLYVDNHVNRLWYRSKYEAESQRADSLYAETVRLEQRLRHIEAVKEPHVSTAQPGNSKGAGLSPTSAL